MSIQAETRPTADSVDVRRDVRQMVNQALDEGLLDLIINERSLLPMDLRLFMLEVPAVEIKKAFAMVESSSAEVLLTGDAADVRDYCLSEVQKITGMTPEDAGKLVTNESTWVSTIMDAIVGKAGDADSKYKGRAVRTRLGNAVSIAMMRQDRPSIAGIHASISHLRHAKNGSDLGRLSGEDHPLHMYFVESYLRKDDGLQSYVLRMKEGEPPVVSLKYWDRKMGGLVEHPMTAAESEMYMMAIMSDLLVAHQNADTSHDAAALVAAQPYK